MDELKALWGEIRSNEDLELLTGKQISENIRQESKGTMTGLYRQVIAKLFFCVLALACLLVTIPFIQRSEIQILMTILLAAYLVGSILLYQEARLLKNTIAMDQNLLDALQSFQKRFTDILKYEQIISLILYPITATAGFLAGMYFFNPQTLLIDEPKDWLLLLTPMVILTPLAYWVNHIWNRYSHGNHLQQLTDNIAELEKGS